MGRGRGGDEEGVEDEKGGIVQVGKKAICLRVFL